MKNFKALSGLLSLSATCLFAMAAFAQTEQVTDISQELFNQDIVPMKVLRKNSKNKYEVIANAKLNQQTKVLEIEMGEVLRTKKLKDQTGLHPIAISEDSMHVTDLPQGAVYVVSSSWFTNFLIEAKQFAVTSTLVTPKGVEYAVGPITTQKAITLTQSERQGSFGFEKSIKDLRSGKAVYLGVSAIKDIFPLEYRAQQNWTKPDGVAVYIRIRKNFRK